MKKSLVSILYRWLFLTFNTIYYIIYVKPDAAMHGAALSFHQSRLSLPPSLSGRAIHAAGRADLLNGLTQLAMLEVQSHPALLQDAHLRRNHLAFSPIARQPPLRIRSYRRSHKRRRSRLPELLHECRGRPPPPVVWVLLFYRLHLFNTGPVFKRLRDRAVVRP